jgi:hypothetical protein
MVGSNASPLCVKRNPLTLKLSPLLASTTILDPPAQFSDLLSLIPRKSLIDYYPDKFNDTELILYPMLYLNRERCNVAWYIELWMLALSVSRSSAGTPKWLPPALLDVSLQIMLFLG